MGTHNHVCPLFACHCIYSFLATFPWQYNRQVLAVKTYNSSFFIWRHFVSFNQGFNWQAGSGWVARRAGAQRGHWLPSVSPLVIFFLMLLFFLFLSPAYFRKLWCPHSQFHKHKITDIYVYSLLCFHFIPLYYQSSHMTTLLNIDKRVYWWLYWCDKHGLILVITHSIAFITICKCAYVSGDWKLLCSSLMFWSPPPSYGR